MLRNELLMAEICKVAVIWVSGKDDSHFENFCHHLLFKLIDNQRVFLTVRRL